MPRYIRFFYNELEILNLDKRTRIFTGEVDAPKDCYGYNFFEFKEIDFGGVKSNYLVNIPGSYYFGKIISLDEIKREMPNKKFLIWKMEQDGLDKLVKLRTGGFQPLEKIDKVIEE